MATQCDSTVRLRCPDGPVPMECDGTDEGSAAPARGSFESTSLGISLAPVVHLPADSGAAGDEDEGSHGHDASQPSSATSEQVKHPNFGLRFERTSKPGNGQDEDGEEDATDALADDEGRSDPSKAGSPTAGLARRQTAGRNPLASLEALVAACELAAEQEGLDDDCHYYHALVAESPTMYSQQHRLHGATPAAPAVWAAAAPAAGGAALGGVMPTALHMPSGSAFAPMAAVGAAFSLSEARSPWMAAPVTVAPMALAAAAPKYRRHKSKVFIRPNKVVYLPTSWIEEAFQPSQLPINCEMIVEADGNLVPGESHHVTIKAVPRQGLSTMYCMTNVLKFQQQYLHWQILHWTKMDDSHIKIHLQGPNSPAPAIPAAPRAVSVPTPRADASIAARAALLAPELPAAAAVRPAVFGVPTPADLMRSLSTSAAAVRTSGRSSFEADAGAADAPLRRSVRTARTSGGPPHMAGAEQEDGGPATWAPGSATSAHKRRSAELDRDAQGGFAGVLTGRVTPPSAALRAEALFGLSAPALLCPTPTPPPGSVMNASVTAGLYYLGRAKPAGITPTATDTTTTTTADHGHAGGDNSRAPSRMGGPCCIVTPSSASAGTAGLPWEPNSATGGAAGNPNNALPTGPPSLPGMLAILGCNPDVIAGGGADPLLMRVGTMLGPSLAVPVPATGAVSPAHGHSTAVPAAGSGASSGLGPAQHGARRSSSEGTRSSDSCSGAGVRSGQVELDTGDDTEQLEGGERSASLAANATRRSADELQASGVPGAEGGGVVGASPRARGGAVSSKRQKGTSTDDALAVPAAPCSMGVPVSGYFSCDAGLGVQGWHASKPSQALGVPALNPPAGFLGAAGAGGVLSGNPAMQALLALGVLAQGSGPAAQNALVALCAALPDPSGAAATLQAVLAAAPAAPPAVMEQ